MDLFLRQPAVNSYERGSGLDLGRTSLTNQRRRLSNLPTAGLESAPHTLKGHPVGFEVHECLVSPKSAEPLADVTKNSLDLSNYRLARLLEPTRDCIIFIENEIKQHKPLRPHFKQD
jgi:hypothetical protein